MQSENIPGSLVITLIRKHLNEEITSSEWEILQLWLAEAAWNQTLFDQLSDEHYRIQELKEMSAYPDEEIAFANFISKMNVKGSTAKISSLPTPKVTATKARKVWVLIAQAAAVLILIGTGLFYYTAKKINSSGFIVYKNDIAAGHIGATLTLANGEKISLNQKAAGEIAKNTGVSIRKSESGKLLYQIIGKEMGAGEENTLSTQKAETYQVELPDGSRVWLNAASSLTYSTNMQHSKNRSVQLRGEAYFEVAKDKEHPFIVESLGQNVEVLGTHFNINAYPGETGKTTTLLEGSVKVSEGTIQQVLKPGFEAFNSGTDIQMQSVDPALSIGWKNGKLIFENQKIDRIMKMVERWYNVQIIYSGEMPEDVFAGSVSRFDKVSHVLNILESTGRIHFKIDGRKIYVSK